jgi:regulatory protein
MIDKSKINDEDALARMIRWCAYRERSIYETKQKLQSFELSASDLKNILQYLSERGYVDDLRFARAFVRGKFRQNQWGRLKIQAGLRNQHIAPDIIKKALGVIDESEYERIMLKLAVAKAKSFKEEANAFENKTKIFRYLSSKGFTPDEIRKTAELLFSK